MKLSVIIPTFNMAALLRQGLSFLAAQQLPPGTEYEIIVVDDGSSDDTRAVMEQLTAHNPVLRYHFIPRGPRSCRAATRNLGIEVARGEFLVFLDSGVLVSPHFLSDVTARLEGAPQRVLLHPVHGLVAGY
ncbi:MAG TPA: glycosyltransferase family A protein, partial [Myxococcaceae bacterium]